MAPWDPGSQIYPNMAQNRPLFGVQNRVFFRPIRRNTPLRAHPPQNGLFRGSAGELKMGPKMGPQMDPLWEGPDQPWPPATRTCGSKGATLCPGGSHDLSAIRGPIYLPRMGPEMGQIGCQFIAKRPNVGRYPRPQYPGIRNITSREHPS